MKMKLFYVALAAILLACTPMAAWSQAVLTKTDGKVRDGNKPVPDAQVVLTHQDSGKTWKVKTDKSGLFSLIGLTRGAYTIEVQAANGDVLYREKNHQMIGEGGDANKLDLDLSGPGGSGGGAKVSKEEIEKIKASNAKASSMNALINQYNAAQAAKNWGEAETLLKQMIATEPTNWRFNQALGDVQYNQGGIYQSYAEGKSKPPEGDLRSQADFAPLSQKEYEDSVASYGKGIEGAQAVISANAPKDANKPESDPVKAKAGIGQMLSAQGNAYIKLKKNKEAVEAFTKAAEMDPNPGVAYFNLCATQYNTGNKEGALVACDKAIAADPNKADAYFIKGSLMMGDGKLDAQGKYTAPPGTAETLNKYLEVAPDGPHANDVKAMLQAIGAKIETTYGTRTKKK